MGSKSVKIKRNARETGPLQGSSRTRVRFAAIMVKKRLTNQSHRLGTICCPPTESVGDMIQVIMGNEPPQYWDALVKTVSGSLGLKIGPGVLVVVGWVIAIGLAATAAAVWALQANPWLALAAAILILTVAAYFAERAFRYAEKNPIPALMGGAELLKVIEHQIGAKDKSIVSPDTTVQAGLPAGSVMDQPATEEGGSKK